VRWLYVHPRSSVVTNSNGSGNGNDLFRSGNSQQIAITDGSLSPSSPRQIADESLPLSVGKNDSLVSRTHNENSVVAGSHARDGNSTGWLNISTVVTTIVISFSLGLFIGTRKSFRVVV
jgi:hypothetical protein